MNELVCAVRPMLSQRLIEMLRCPRCRSVLNENENDFECSMSECAEIFPVVNGVPILINEDKSVFRKSHFTVVPPAISATQSWKRFMRRILPQLEVNSTGKDVMARFKEEVMKLSPRPIVLNVGGKHEGSLSSIVASGTKVECVEVDLNIKSRTNVISDPCSLPLADESVEVVIVDAFLEHAIDPFAVVEELHRVLKKDGLIYVDTPFMLQVHGGAYDFTRFSHLALLRLFKKFSELESGVSCGPGSALANSIQYFMLSFVQSSTGRAVVQGFCRLAFFWLKYFDHYLAKKPGSIDAALGLFFSGRKSDVSLDDQALIKQYRGQSLDLF